MATERITITGDLSVDELQKIMAGNAAYRTNNDLVMARNWIDAAEALLAIPLSEFDHAGERARVEIRVVQERLDKAISWLSVRDAVDAMPVGYVPARDWRDS